MTRLGDPQMPWLRAALDPVQVQTQFRQCLPAPYRDWAVARAAVIRHKPGRRCLIEYDLGGDDRGITLIGKVRAKGLDSFSYHLQQALWEQGFRADSSDGVSVPEPIAMVPAWQMWLQRKVPGQLATHLLPGPEGISLSARIAAAAHKLHQAKIPPKRCHTIADELRILRERLPLVAQDFPQWEDRLEQILGACAALAASLPEPQRRGIHRDFYPDQIIVDGSRLYLLDLDLYCAGDPGLDIGNFRGHVIEQSLRTLGSAAALVDCEIALTEQFVKLAGDRTRRAIEIYTTLTLVRHIYLSTQFLERRPYTQTLLELCESRLFPSPQNPTVLHRQGQLC